MEIIAKQIISGDIEKFNIDQRFHPLIRHISGEQIGAHSMHYLDICLSNSLVTGDMLKGYKGKMQITIEIIKDESD